jgi:hypothetical protein
MVDSIDKDGGASPAPDGFSLSRWSRLKRAGADAGVAGAQPEVAVPASVANASASAQSAATSERAATAEPDGAQALPPLYSISLAEDFTPFMQAKVPQALRQQALKALFKEPHFNVMDGLDIYIDDYTVFEPISPEVMATLSSWKTIMNPPQQVVTPGGHAVDVESEEGKAVLAARDEAQIDSGHATDEENAQPVSVNEEASAERQPQPAPVHARYGKRVGDFTAMPLVDTDASESFDSDNAIAPTETTPIPEKDA